MHAITGTAPEVAVLIDLKAIGPAHADFVEELPLLEGVPIGCELVANDELLGLIDVMGTGFSNVEPAFIGRKSQTIGPSEIPDYRLEISSLGIEAIERRRLFGLLSSCLLYTSPSPRD